MQAAAKIRGLADVRLGLCVLAAQQEYRWRGRDGGEDFRIAFGGEFQALGQHAIILVRIYRGERLLPRIHADSHG